MAVGKTEEYNLRVLTAEFPTRIFRICRQRVEPRCGSRGALVIVAVVRGAVPPADTVLVFGDMFFANQESVALPVRVVEQANAHAELERSARTGTDGNR